MLSLGLVYLFLNGVPSINPRWEVALERNGGIWLASADGSHLRPLCRKGSHPKWSPDGKRLLYQLGTKVVSLDIKSGKETSIFNMAKPPAEDLSHFGLAWDPNLPAVLIATDDSTTLDLVGPLDGSRILHTKLVESPHIELPTYAPAWSPNGKYFAMVRGGDIWMAKRQIDVGKQKPRLEVQNGQLWNGSYYSELTRIAPLAVFLEEDHGGVSATTPFWVDEIAWTGDSHRIVFHFQRQGGSGVSRIGYVDLEPIPKRAVTSDWMRWPSGFKTHTTWIDTRGLVFSPRICPDGKTLTFERGGDLYTSDWKGKQTRLILRDAGNVDWRPLHR